MSITSIASTATTSTTDTSTSTSSTYVSSEDFLTLLLVQLENQDPLDPVDTETFTSQLCSLSQLEQATITNEYLEDLLAYQSNSSNSQVIDYIGKSVDIEGDSFTVTDGSAEELAFVLADDASEVSATIYDEDGNAVWSEDLSDLSAGTHYLSLDEDDLADLGDGDYTFEVSAYDTDGDSVEVTTYTTAEVTGIIYEDDVPYLVAGNQTISLDDVESVHQ